MTPPAYRLVLLCPQQFHRDKRLSGGQIVTLAYRPEGRQEVGAWGFCLGEGTYLDRGGRRRKCMVNKGCLALQINEVKKFPSDSSSLSGTQHGDICTFFWQLEGKSFSWVWWVGLGCLQLKIIQTPTWHILGCQVLNSFSIKGFSIVLNMVCVQLMKTITLCTYSFIPSEVNTIAEFRR